MDEWLSQVYGTGQQGGDIEKTAQNMMLQKLAEEEGIDLSGLNDEELDALAQAVVAQGEGGEQVSAAPAAGEGGEEELQAKFAEADFLGRVMAHAYTQELQKIASEEGAAPPAAAPKVCDDCGKAKCECPPAEKTASGPVARAITALGGTIEGAQPEVPEAVKLAFATLQAHGYIE